MEMVSKMYQGRGGCRFKWLLLYSNVHRQKKNKKQNKTKLNKQNKNKLTEIGIYLADNFIFTVYLWRDKFVYYLSFFPEYDYTLTLQRKRLDISQNSDFGLKHRIHGELNWADTSHLPQRIWDKGYYRHCEVSLISWPALWNDGKGKQLIKLYDKRDDFFQSTFLSSVATSLQDLRTECSYHNSCVIQELAETTQTFCIALDF